MGHVAVSSGQTFIEVLIALFLVMAVIFGFHQFQISVLARVNRIHHAEIMISLAGSMHDYQYWRFSRQLNDHILDHRVVLHNIPFTIKATVEYLSVLDNRGSTLVIKKFIQ